MFLDFLPGQVPVQVLHAFVEKLRHLRIILRVVNPLDHKGSDIQLGQLVKNFRYNAKAHSATSFLP